MVKIYYDKDASLAPLQGKTVAIIGYGSQGHAQAQNLRDSGVNVIVGELEGTTNYALAVEHGFKPMSAAEATQKADVVHMLVPDHIQKPLYEKEIEPHMKDGKALAFSHGFNIHFKCIKPAPGIDVYMVAPKGPGHLVRDVFVEGGGVPCLFAVYQDASGQATALALAHAMGVGGTRAGVIETTFKDETETDLFGEQTILCGGVSSLMKAAFETLVEAGYPAELAYFECCHELKLITDLIYKGGLNFMRYSVSDTAEYGDYSRGPRIVTDQTRAELKKILGEIQSGEFANEWIKENETGRKNFLAMREKDKNHPMEVVGAELRKMMGWLGKKK